MCFLSRSERLESARDWIGWLGIFPVVLILAGAAIGAVSRNAKWGIAGCVFALAAVMFLLACWERVRWLDANYDRVGVECRLATLSIPDAAQPWVFQADKPLSLAIACLVAMLIASAWMDSLQSRPSAEIIAAVAAGGLVLCGMSIAGSPESQRFWLATWSLISTAAVATMHGNRNGRHGWWTWQLLGDSALFAIAAVASDSRIGVSLSLLDRLWVIVVLWKLVRPTMVAHTGATVKLVRFLLPLLWVPLLLDTRFVHADWTRPLQEFVLALLISLLILAAIARSIAMATPMRIAAIAAWQMIGLSIAQSTTGVPMRFLVVVALSGLMLVNADPRPKTLRPGGWRLAGEMLLSGIPWIGFGWPLMVVLNLELESAFAAGSSWSERIPALVLVAGFALQSAWLGRTIRLFVEKRPAYFPLENSWSLMLPTALGIALIPVAMLWPAPRSWLNVSKPVFANAWLIVPGLVGIAVGYLIQSHRLFVADFNPGPKSRRFLKNARSTFDAIALRFEQKAGWELAQILVRIRRESESMSAISRGLIAILFLVVIGGAAWWSYGR